MNFRFITPAEAELDDAVRYYNNQRAGLGEEFVDEIVRTIRQILAHPRTWPKLSRRTRRCLTSRFPFGIIYEIREHEILIVAVMHLKRKPGYWKSRLR